MSNLEETHEEVQDHDLPKSQKYVNSHPKDLIISDTSQGIRTKSSLRNINNYLTFIFLIEPKNIKKGESDPNWIIAIEEELN